MRAPSMAASLRSVAVAAALLLPVAAHAQLAPTVCASASSCVLKASAGALVDGYVTTTAAGYLYAFNSATAPSDGAVVGGTASGDYQDCVYVPANSSQAVSTAGTITEKFSAGITLMFSSTACGTLTASTAAFLKGRVQQ